MAGRIAAGLSVHRRLSASLRLCSGLLVVTLLFTACAGTGGEAERLNQEGNRAYLVGDYQRALDAYRRAAVDRPDLTQINYNAGNALDRLGQLDQAVRESQKAAATGSDDTRFRAYYALGNHFAAQGRWQAAYESYRNALILNPSDMDAKYNLEVALRMAVAQNAQQQASQQGQQGEQGQSGGQQPTQGQQGAQQAGQQGQPGPQQAGRQADQGQPQPGQAGQQPGQQGAQAQTPQPGQAATTGGGQGQPQPGIPDSATAAAAAEQNLKDALSQFDQNVSIEDALRVLDALAAQEAQRRQQIPGPPPGSNVKDQ